MIGLFYNTLLMENNESLVCEVIKHCWITYISNDDTIVMYSLSSTLTHLRNIYWVVQQIISDKFFYTTLLIKNNESLVCEVIKQQKQ